MNLATPAVNSPASAQPAAVAPLAKPAMPGVTLPIGVELVTCQAELYLYDNRVSEVKLIRFS